ncbi:MAG: AfsR/SARP family transcriptional regulator [Acidimicrobiia bacterium]|nr:AfsR/SARP family transcriptional regulator [Acidimicrobiia bacterium]
MAGNLRFRVLGPLEVHVNSSIEFIGGRRERALLAGLLLTPGEAVEVDRLADLLWPAKPPRDIGHALRTHVMRLRQHIGRDLVVTSPGAYAIVVEPETVDVHRFDQATTAGTVELAQRRLDAAEARLAEAVDIWHQGAPWIDLAGTVVGDAERARLVERRLEVEERLAAVRLRLGRSPVDDIEKLAVEAPLREHRWLLLMHALYVAGEQTRALRAYESLRARLRDELGLEPDRRVRAMEHRILEHDPGLSSEDPVSFVLS